MPELSVVVIAKNEEKNIGDCLSSVGWADEIVVVDAGSTDKTIALAKKFTKKVFVQPWSGYGAARNFGVKKATNDWVFWMDADERMTPELQNEILRSLQSFNANVVAYQVARKAFFMGRWIKHCGWYPGWVTRLFKKESGQFTENRVHEQLKVRGQVGRIHADLLHFTDPDLFHYFEKFNRYTTLAAEELIQQGERFSLTKLFLNPAWMFIKMYFLRRGFLDGLQGLILCVLSSAYVFTKYAKLWEKSRE